MGMECGALALPDVVLIVLGGNHRYSNPHSAHLRLDGHSFWLQCSNHTGRKWHCNNWNIIVYSLSSHMGVRYRHWNDQRFVHLSGPDCNLVNTSWEHSRRTWIINSMWQFEVWLIELCIFTNNLTWTRGRWRSLVILSLIARESLTV